MTTDGTNNNGTEVITPAENTPWFMEEGVPGVGQRPTWLDQKFKTVADLGKSYHELEKKIAVVPDEYDVSNAKFIDPGYEPFQDFLKLAKDKRVPKEVMDKMVDTFDGYMDQFNIDPAKEAAKLGDNAQERLKTLDNWVQANFSKDTYEALTKTMVSADAIKALEEIRGKSMSNATVVPNGNDTSTNNVASLDDLRAEMSNNLEKYKTDPTYRKDLSARFELAGKNAGYVDKSQR